MHRGWCREGFFADGGTIWLRFRIINMGYVGEWSGYDRESVGIFREGTGGFGEGRGQSECRLGIDAILFNVGGALPKAHKMGLVGGRRGYEGVCKVGARNVGSNAAHGVSELMFWGRKSKRGDVDASSCPSEGGSGGLYFRVGVYGGGGSGCDRNRISGRDRG